MVKKAKNNRKKEKQIMAVGNIGRPSLEQQYPDWNDLCDHILTKITIKKGEQKKFREWFMEREPLGLRFDPKMIKRCYFIWKELKKGLDHFIVICGREGWGKSTLAINIAAWIDPRFTKARIVSNTQEYLEQLHKKADAIKETGIDRENAESLVLDEGTDLLSRESLSKTNVMLTKTFFIQRALGFLVIVNIPNFFMLDTVVRLHRVRTLIELTGAKEYKAITSKGIKIVAKVGAKEKNVLGVKLPTNWFWYGSFQFKFPNTVDYLEYEKQKLQGIVGTLNELKDNSKLGAFVKSSTAAKKLGVKTNVIVANIKKGKIKGKKIGGTWYIPKEEAEKVFNTEIA